MTEKKETPNQYEETLNPYKELDKLMSGLLWLFVFLTVIFAFFTVAYWDKTTILEKENKQLNAKIAQIQEENEYLKKGVIVGCEIDECLCVATFEEEGRMFVWNGNTVICAELNRQDIVLPTINAGDIVYIAYSLKDFSDAEVIGVQPK